MLYLLGSFKIMSLYKNIEKQARTIRITLSELWKTSQRFIATKEKLNQEKGN